MSEEVQGQAQPEQPYNVMDAALAFVKQESTPRDDQGRFTKPETQEAQAQPEGEAETQETTEAETTEETQPQPELPKFKLKVKTDEGADEEIEVDEEELKRGYMKSKDYSVKTAQLARERESVQQKVKEAIEPKLKEYDEKLQIAEQVIWHTLAPQIQGTDWNKLASENPAEWAQKYQSVQNVQAQLARIQAERHRIAQAKDAESKQSEQKQVREAVEVLQRDIPGWNEELYGKILKSAVDNGFSKEQAHGIKDPALIKVLNKARQWDEYKSSAKPAADKKKVAVPKVVKPGTADKPDPNADKWKQGLDSFKKSGGKWQAGTSLALQLLKNEK